MGVAKHWSKEELQEKRGKGGIEGGDRAKLCVKQGAGVKGGGEGEK